MKEKDKVSYLFEEAVNCFNQGDYRSAVAAWKEILKYDPENSQAKHGIRVAGERMGEEEAAPPAPAPAASKPAAPATPPKAAKPAAGGGGGVSFDVGESDLGDPFAEAVEAGEEEEEEAPASPLDESFDLGQEIGEDTDSLFGDPFAADAPAAPGKKPVPPPARSKPAPPPAAEREQPPTPAPEEPDLGEPVPAGEGLDAWGLPAEEKLDEGATMLLGGAQEPAAPAAAGGDAPAGGGGEVLDADLGEPLIPEEEPASAPAAEQAGGDEFGWGEELGEPGTLDDLGGVGALEDLDLPSEPDIEEPSFADRPEAPPLQKVPGTDEFDFGEEPEDIPLGGPAPIPPPPPHEEEEDLEEDLELEPERQPSIPLARPVPRPASIPTYAPPRRSPMPMVLGGIIVVALAVIGVVAALSVFRGGGGTTEDGQPTGPSGPTTTPVSPAGLACDEAILAWRQYRLGDAVQKGEACLKAGKGQGGVPQKDLDLVGSFLPIARRLSGRPKDFQDKYIKAVYEQFCKTHNWDEAYATIKDLNERYPQYRDELKPYLLQIYYNSGVEELQAKAPREAVFYFEQLLKLDPGDEKARDLQRFAQSWTNKYLSTEYTSYVDPLSSRQEGCESR